MKLTTYDAQVEKLQQKLYPTHEQYELDSRFLSTQSLDNQTVNIEHRQGAVFTRQSIDQQPAIHRVSRRLPNFHLENPTKPYDQKEARKKPCRQTCFDQLTEFEAKKTKLSIYEGDVDMLQNLCSDHKENEINSRFVAKNTRT